MNHSDNPIKQFSAIYAITNNSSKFSDTTVGESSRYWVPFYKTPVPL